MIVHLHCESIPEYVEWEFVMPGPWHCGQKIHRVQEERHERLNLLCYEQTLASQYVAPISLHVHCSKLEHLDINTVH